MRKKLLLMIFLLQAFIFNLTNVITPSYLNDLGLCKSSFGLFTALWSVGMLLSSPMWGYLGDRYKRKKFIIIGLIIYGLAQLMFFYSTSIPLLYLMRVISGVGVGAPVTLLMTYLIKQVKSNERAKYLSLRMAFITLGVTFSYFIGGYIGLQVTKDLFVYQSVLSIVFMFLVFIIMKEDGTKTCVYPENTNIFYSIRHIKKLNPKLLLFYFTISLSMIALINTDKFIDLYVIDQGYDSFVLGSLKATLGIVSFAANMFILPKLKRFLGNMYIMQGIQIIMGIIILVVFINNDLLIMLYTAFIPFVLLKAIYQTSEQLFISNQVQNHEVGLYMGIRQSFVCFGMIIGPLVGGFVYQIHPENLFTFNVICLLISSLILSYIRTSDFLDENLILTS